MDARQYQDALAQHHAGTGLVFAEEEYTRRVDLVKSQMSAKGIETLICTDPNSVYYLTGYYTFGSGNYVSLIMPLDGSAFIHVADLEIPSAIINSNIADVYTSIWQQQFRVGPGDDLVDLLHSKRQDKKRIGLELGRKGLLASVYQALASKLPNAKFIDASMLVEEVSYVKSSVEVECLRKSGSYTAAGIDASYAITRPGIYDNDIAKAGYEAMIGAGSEFMSVQPIVTSGVRTSYPHQNFRRVLIQDHDVIFLEYGGNHHRYTAPLMRTIFTGKPSDDMMRFADAAEATLTAMLEMMKPGIEFRDVVAHAKKAHKSIDDELYFFGSYAYGLGATFPPTWGNGLHISDGIDLVLKPGMAFHVPMNFTAPSKFGIAFSESVVITDDGYELLVDHPRKLHQI
ncbi:Xaa-Pro peptidase family protein [Mesorhizobium opportunistum]|uniref:M24 family metallopeptidase n=1 Tax=Mesorhizobium opportunistum TaxID=593909 RepID=UPI00333C8910